MWRGSLGDQPPFSWGPSSPSSATASLSTTILLVRFLWRKMYQVCLSLLLWIVLSYQMCFVSYNIAQNNLKELEHVALEDPSISSTENEVEQLEHHAKCFGCWEPLANSVHFSPYCGFNLHKQCAELPLKINHTCHRKHPLFLQLNGKRLSCKICQLTEQRGFLYCCLPCEFAVHIQCASPEFMILDKSHQHSFTKFLGQLPFICNAFGTEGNYVAHLCCTCNIIVHEKCMSLPRIIKSRWHHHRIFHTYFLQDENFRSWKCIICLNEVNTEHGSSSCSDCEFIAHVKCAMRDEDWYYVVSEEDEDEESSDSLELSSITVIEKNDAGEATKIEHFKHMHCLTLSGEIVEHEKCCDGCILPISPPYFRCSACDFFLHKACAELPKKKRLWFDNCQRHLLTLFSDCIFRCELCEYVSNGFGYKCNECEEYLCLRCVTLTPGPLKHPGHPHPLFFHVDYEGPCSGCTNSTTKFPYYCKDCNFALDACITLPTTARHKCDPHLLALTYHETNEYSLTHYCDICEERRDPKYWFYHCATCDTSTHVDCVLGDFFLIKPGSIYKEGDHPHPLTFVKKIYYYPKCSDCGELCQDLALECAESECNYVVHCLCP